MLLNVCSSSTLFLTRGTVSTPRELSRAVNSVKETIGNLELHMPRSHTAETVRSCLPKCCSFSLETLSECCNGWQWGKKQNPETKKPQQNSLWEQPAFVPFTLLPLEQENPSQSSIWCLSHLMLVYLCVPGTHNEASSYTDTCYPKLVLLGKKTRRIFSSHLSSKLQCS